MQIQDRGRVMDRAHVAYGLIGVRIQTGNRISPRIVNQGATGRIERVVTHVAGWKRGDRTDREVLDGYRTARIGQHVVGQHRGDIVGTRVEDTSFVGPAIPACSHRARTAEITDIGDPCVRE